jgi:hypothetical protein
MTKQKIIIGAGTCFLVSVAAFVVYLPNSAMGKERREQVANQEIERPQKMSPGSVRGLVYLIRLGSIVIMLAFAIAHCCASCCLQ